MNTNNLVCFCLIFATPLVHGEKAYEPLDPLTGINTTTTATSPSKSDVTELGNSAEQFENDLTIADVRNILEIFLILLERQPDIPTLKLLNLLINSLIKQNSATKHMHAKLLHELQEDDELRSLLSDLDLDLGGGDKSSITVSQKQFEPLPAIIQSTTEDDLKFRNLPVSAAESLAVETDSVEETNPTKVSTKDNFTATTNVPLKSYTFKQVSTTNPPFISSFVKTKPYTSVIDILKRLVPTMKQRPSELSNADVTSKKLNVFPVTTAPTTAAATKIMELETSSSTFSAQPLDQQLNKYANPIPVTSNINVSSKQNVTNMFSPLADNLLEILCKYNLKYVRTYSESLEPLSFKKTDNNKTNENIQNRPVDLKSRRRKRSIKPEPKNEQLLFLQDDKLLKILRTLLNNSELKKTTADHLNYLPILNLGSSISQQHNNRSLLTETDFSTSDQEKVNRNISEHQHELSKNRPNTQLFKNPIEEESSGPRITKITYLPKLSTAAETADNTSFEKLHLGRSKSGTSGTTVCATTTRKPNRPPGKALDTSSPYLLPTFSADSDRC